MLCATENVAQRKSINRSVFVKNTVQTAAFKYVLLGYQLNTGQTFQVFKTWKVYFGMLVPF